MREIADSKKKKDFGNLKKKLQEEQEKINQ
jgi:hypothetical protein